MNLENKGTKIGYDIIVGGSTCIIRIVGQRRGFSQMKNESKQGHMCKRQGVEEMCFKEKEGL